MKVYTDIKDFIGIDKPVLTVGTFDGVHMGHRCILSRLKDIAKQVGGESVLLTFYPHPRMILFPDDESLKLITTLDEKKKLLEQAGLDHLIVLPFSKEFSRLSPTEYVRDLLVRDLNIHTLVIGYDHRFGRNREGNLELLSELSPIYEFDVQEISAQEVHAISVSSTKIRAALNYGDIATANAFLGHSYQLIGKVISGKQLGRQLGFPTANLGEVPREKLIPARGVYAVKVQIGDKRLNGMLNIGNKPTLKEENSFSIEVHLFDFNRDIYDETITVIFIDKLRDEQRYESLEALRIQLKKDKKKAELLLNS